MRAHVVYGVALLVVTAAAVTWLAVDDDSTKPGGDGVKGATITLTTLVDGTPCAVGTKHQAIALDCDWSAR